MINYVNTVLVAPMQATTVGNLNTAGHLVMVGEDGKVIATDVLAGSAKRVKIGKVSNKTMSYANPSTGAATDIKLVQFSNWINKGSVVSYKTNTYTAPVEDVVTLTGGGSTVPVPGYRYVLRIIYKDIIEHPGQFTHTYEVIASTGETLNTLLGKFTKQINKDDRRRCVASNTATVLTLTALVKDDNEGVNSINEYSRVNMEAVMFYTNPMATGFASKNKYPLPGLTIAKTPGKNGNGFWKIVRDREKFAMSNRGITNRTWFPVIMPDFNTVEGKTYESCAIEFEPEHKTAEDSFSKTKQSVEIYTETGATAFSASMIGKQIAAFCA